MPNPPQTVEDTIHNATKNLETLRDSTAAALKLLLPLCSKNSNVTVMSIVAPAKDYVAAIDCSIIAAQEGFNIVEEAINLSKMQEANTAEATSYLDQMWAMARKGHKNTQDSVNKFKSVRTAIKTFIKEAKKHNENDSHSISLPEDIKILKEFSDSVTKYITWWNFMEMSASSAQKGRAEHHLLNYNSVRERSVIEKWEEMRDAYCSYKVEITLLQSGYKDYPWRSRFTLVDDKPKENERQGAAGVQKQTSTPKGDIPQGKAGLPEAAKPLEQGNTLNKVKRQEAAHLTMSNPPQTVEDTISNATKNLESLKDSTAAALKLLLPLCSKNSDLTVLSIVAPAKNYVAAVDCSIIAAQEGFNIAEEAINLSKMQGASTAEATSYLDGMWAMARKGHKNTQDSVDKFKSVRTAIESSIREAKNHNENDSHSISLPENIKILKEFSDSVTKYITWWNFMEMSASAQKDRAEHHLLNYNSLRERSVIKKWEEMRDAYCSYKVEITLLQTGYKDYPWRSIFPSVDHKPNEDKLQEGKHQDGQSAEKGERQEAVGVQKPTNEDSPHGKAGLQEGAEQGNTLNEVKLQAVKTPRKKDEAGCCTCTIM